MAEHKDDNFAYSNGFYKGEYTTNGQGFSEREQDPDEIDLKRLFFTLWKNKWIIIASVTFFSVLAGIIAYTVTPVYRSEGSILISQQQNSFRPGDSQLGNLLFSTYGIGVGSTIANELLILRSRKLSRVMADSLIDKRVMDNGLQFPLLFADYPDDSSLVEQDTVAMRIRDNIFFTQVDREADMVTIAFESPSPIEASYVVNLSMDVYTDLSTRQNRRSASSAAAFLENERRSIEERLQTVEERLRNFMNKEKLVQLDAQTEGLIERMAALESQKQEARVKLVAVNSAIEQYRERLNNIKPGLAEQYADAIGSSMVRLQYQLAELEIEKMQLIAKNPSIKDSPTPPKELQAVNEQIELYRERIRELTKNLIEDGDQYLGFLGGNEGNIAQAVTELNQKLIERQVEQQQYQAQVDVIDEQLEEQRTFFDNLPDNMIELARLKRDVSISEELFLTVSKQYAETALWEQTQLGTGRIIDPAYIPEVPVKPDKGLYVLIGFIFGVIFSLGFIFIREAYNTTIDSVEKLKAFDIPMLSVIPDIEAFTKTNHKDKKTVKYSGIKVKSSLVTMLDSLSPISESFRRLQSNILYSSPDRKLTSIIITSSSKGEGKTTVTANMGVVMAEAGFKTLVLDTDLRRPNLHNFFGFKRTPGLTDILFGEVDTEQAIRQTPLKNLYVLSSGKDIPNPPAIMQSSKFLELLQNFEQQFDKIIIDSAPFGIITDISAVIKQVDALAVVVRFGQTTEGELAHTLQNLKHLNANVVGSALTVFKPEKSNDYDQSNYYYKNAFREYISYHKS